MAFSMHSHSGQFCPGHAKDNLEEIIETAISRGMQTFALTEHMPRMTPTDLYPEELKEGISPQESLTALQASHDAFVIEALRMREKYASKIKILIGFEGEWIRSSYGPLITSLASHPAIDFFIGSVHHVHEIPIDYDGDFYGSARDAAGGTDERLFEDYFDLQFEMLKALKPKVVGHFDLIKLMSDHPSRDLTAWNGVWERVVRNLRLIVEQGGLVEINTSALRKGLREPYPGREICEEYLKMGGKLTLSDDSHGIVQVGTNYLKGIEFIESLGVEEVFTLEEQGKGVRAVKLSSVKGSFRP